jgi:hypothetical protein
MVQIRLKSRCVFHPHLFPPSVSKQVGLLYFLDHDNCSYFVLQVGHSFQHIVQVSCLVLIDIEGIYLGVFLSQN